MLGELAVVADKDQFRAGFLRVGGQHRHVRGVEHRRLVHDDDGFAVPLLAAVRQHEQLALDGAGVLEAVFLHGVNDFVRPCEADHPMPGRLVGVAHGVRGAALAGAGEAVDQRQPFLTGRMAEGAGLLAADPVMLRAVERGEALRVGEAVAPVRGQAFGRPPHIAFAFQHLARRVAGRRPAALVGQVNRFGMVENLVGELRPRQLDAMLLGVGSAAHRIDFFLQGALEFLAGEGRALPGHRLEDAAGVAPARSRRAARSYPRGL